MQKEWNKKEKKDKDEKDEGENENELNLKGISPDFLRVFGPVTVLLGGWGACETCFKSALQI